MEARLGLNPLNGIPFLFAARNKEEGARFSFLDGAGKADLRRF
jgi:hypothetical protein